MPDLCTLHGELYIMDSGQTNKTPKTRTIQSTKKKYILFTPIQLESGIDCLKAAFLHHRFLKR